MKFSIPSTILFFTTLSILTSATPISNNNEKKAVKKVNCSYFHTGPVIATTAYGTSNAEQYYVGLSSDKLKDSFGASSTFLTTKKADGSQFGDQEFKFDFQSCDSDYMGWKTSYSRYNTYYGHLTPSVSSHQAKHCLTLRSGDVSSASSLMSSSICDQTDDDSQLSNFFSFVNGYYNSLAFLGYKNDTQSSNIRQSYITISDSGRLHFKTGEAPQGTKKFYLSLY